jgi:hypothetical protein
MMSTTRQTHRASELVVNAVQGGLAMASFKKTAGGSPETVTFKDAGLPDMAADSEYVVQVGGETAARVTVDESTITPAGFDVLGAAASEVLHITVHGRFATQPAV